MGFSRFLLGKKGDQEWRQFKENLGDCYIGSIREREQRETEERQRRRDEQQRAIQQHQKREKSMYHSGLDRGREVGHSTGQRQGYSRGQQVGFSRGQEVGRSHGRREGYSMGHRDGYSDGRHDESRNTKRQVRESYQQGAYKMNDFHHRNPGYYEQDPRHGHVKQRGQAPPPGYKHKPEPEPKQPRIGYRYPPGAPAGRKFRGHAETIYGD